MLLSPNDCIKLWPDPSRCLEPLPPISGAAARVRTGSGSGVAAASLSGERTIGGTPVNTAARPLGPLNVRLVGAFTVKLTMPASSAATNRFQLAVDTDATEKAHAIVAKYERDFFGLTWEGNAGLDESVYKLFSQGKIKQALAESVSGKVKWAHNLWGDSTQFEGEFEIAADPQGCIFGLTAKLIGTIKRPNPVYETFVPPLPPTSEIVVEFAGSLRWNLTPAAWLSLARRVGVTKFLRLLKACGVLGKLVLRSLSSSGVLAGLGSVTAGTMAVGGAGGLIGFGIGMTMMAAQATYGRRLGIMRSYCQGYVVRVFEERTKQKGHMTRNRAQNRATDPASGFYMAGYEDAGRAIRASRLSDVEGVLIRRFGTTFSYSFDSNESYFVKRKQHLTYGRTIDDEYSEARKIADAWADEIVENFDEYQDYVDQYAGDVSKAGW